MWPPIPANQDGPLMWSGRRRDWPELDMGSINSWGNRTRCLHQLETPRWANGEGWGISVLEKWRHKWGFHVNRVFGGVITARRMRWTKNRHSMLREPGSSTVRLHWCHWLIEIQQIDMTCAWPARVKVVLAWVMQTMPLISHWWTEPWWHSFQGWSVTTPGPLPVLGSAVAAAAVSWAPGRGGRQFEAQEIQAKPYVLFS